MMFGADHLNIQDGTPKVRFGGSMKNIREQSTFGASAASHKKFTKKNSAIKFNHLMYSNLPPL